MLEGAYLALLQDAGRLADAAGEAIVGQGLLQHGLHGGVDIHGLAGDRGRNLLLLNLLGDIILLAAPAG